MGHTFKRVGSFSSGYNPAQVDDFLERAKRAYAGEEDLGIDEKSVRTVSFDWVRKGYDPALVDAALDRLEAAFLQRKRARVMDNEGEDTWLSTTYEMAQALYPRLLRPAGERFADADGVGYRKEEVDGLLEQLAEYFDGKPGLTSLQIREATFGKARDGKAYRETVVDAYLDHATTVLMAVE